MDWSQRFKGELISLFPLLSEIISNANSAGVETSLSPMKISLGGNLLNLLDATNIIENFISKSYSSWAEIKKRDPQVAKDKLPSFFDDSLRSYVEEVVSFIGNDTVVTPSIMQRLWEGIDNLSIIAVKHIHHTRGAKLDESGKQIGYINNYFPEISVRVARELFEIKDWN